MPAFHMLLHCPSRRDARRIDFHAEGPDHAFQIARNEADGTGVELWEGDKLLVRMAKTIGNVWEILPSDGACSHAAKDVAKEAQDRPSIAQAAPPLSLPH
ncbi:hypothetical protein GGC65_002402 [Sphingopyxis sp. OAS728]|uniref:hypothetical protein n=1 Tax=Sphingopyxis sp. OAS728 TaxID=2663823 RepID=UPI00178B1282|nr:hypothetical protein [Sphingopyxis sp. OAS728]MBE1527946.1 hypothetical protein [Sphingopyxis sp. OAS728]